MKNLFRVNYLVLGIGFSFGWFVGSVTQIKESGVSNSVKTFVNDKPPTSETELPTSAKLPLRKFSSVISNKDFLSKYAQNGRITGEGMARAVGEFSTTNDPLLRRQMFASVLDHLTPENAAGAYEAFVKHSKRPGGRNEETLLLANAWGRLAPRDALASISKFVYDSSGNYEEPWEGGPCDNPDSAEVLAGWAAVNPAEASKFLEETSGDKDLLTNGLVRGLLANGVDQAKAWVLDIPATPENLKLRTDSIGTVANGILVQRGFESAVSWICTLPDKSLKSSGFTRIAEVAAPTRDGTAGEARDFFKEYASEDSAKDAVITVAKQWAANSPVQTLEWADEKFPENVREIIYSDAMVLWTQKHPHNASVYLAKMPQSPMRDLAVGEFSKIIASSEPESAIKWAETIQDTKKRAEAFKSIAASWLKSDYGAAINWLASNGIAKRSLVPE